MEHVDVHGLRTAFRIAGEGPPLLLLHGGVSDSRVWRDQLGEFADEFTVVAWDAPGCGESADPPETFRLADYADHLAAFVQELGLGRPHVLGHSFGGGLALELYHRHPDIPVSLLLVGAFAGWAGSLPPDEVRTRLDFALRMADGLERGVEVETMPGLISDAMPVEGVAELEQIMSEVRPVGVRVMARAFAEADLRDVLPHITVPTLLLYGDADERAPLHVAEALQAAIPDSTLVVMPGLGHECYLESPQAFNTEVRRFLHSIA